MAKKFRVQKSNLIALLAALGLNSAHKWPEPRLLGNIKRLPDLLKESPNVDPGEHGKLLKELLAATEAGDKIIITDDGPSKSDKEAAAPAKKKDKKTAVPAKSEDSASDKPAKKKDKPATKPAKATKGDAASKPGVIQTIIDTLKKANKKAPISRADILKVLVKKFPEREESSMKNTVALQVPKCLLDRKGIEVKGDSKKGFWLP